ncbi:hypothetical protein ACOSP7_030934 [Xanthoceras sorbifolium]
MWMTVLKAVQIYFFYWGGEGPFEELVVNLVLKGSYLNHHLFNLIQECSNLSAGEWTVSLVHIYRKVNRLANGMTVLGHEMKLGFRSFDVTPPSVLSLFDDNCMELALLG